MKIAIGCDHGALELKNTIVAHLQKKGYDAVDFSMTDGFGLVYAEEFDYEGTDAEKEKKVILAGFQRPRRLLKI